MAQPPSEEQDPRQEAGRRTGERAQAVARVFLERIATAGPETDAVLLVVEELVTNAVRHGGGVTGFQLEADAGTVTVTVEDAAPQPPLFHDVDASEPSGYGWQLVHELAIDVRVRLRSDGKTVRVTLPLGP
ncbi:ATP-binding protein [Streptomyces sp. NPDC002004]